MKEIQKILKIENSKVLIFFLNKTLKNIQNLTDLDTFLKIMQIFKEILKNIKNDFFEYKTALKKNFFEFICPFLEKNDKKLTETLDNENWGVIQEDVPLITQKQINMIFSENFDEIKNFLNKNIFKKIISLDYSEEIKELKKNKIESENLIKISEENNILGNNNENLNQITGNNVKQDDVNTLPQMNVIKNFIEIENSKYKVMNSTITLINYFFETYKIILISEDSLMPHICDSICSLFTKFLEINNEMVLDGEGVKRGKLKAIYQKEISMVCSNTRIIKKFVKLLSTNLLLSPIFADLEKLIDKILAACNSKISELFQYT